jgi:hypothetical protein
MASFFKKPSIFDAFCDPFSTPIVSASLSPFITSSFESDEDFAPALIGRLSDTLLDILFSFI